MHRIFEDMREILDLLTEGELFQGAGFTAEIHNPAKVWIAYTEYTISISESNVGTLLLSEFLVIILLHYKLGFYSLTLLYVVC